MKSRSMLLLALCFTVFAASAQSRASDRLSRKEVKGFTIKVLRNIDGTYGYLVYRGEEKFVKQIANPYSGSTAGLKKKEDALKTAEWVVNNIIGLPGALDPKRILYTRQKLRERLPGSLAGKLGIQIK